MARRCLVLAFALPVLGLAQSLSGLLTEAHAPTTPIRGAVIRVSQPPAALLTAELETGKDGRFLTPIDLPTGDYRLEISKPNHSPVTLTIRLPASAPLNIQLTKNGSITGRVIDAQGRPIRGAHIIPMIASEEDSTKFLRAIHANLATVDSSGNYRVFNLKPGRYALAVSWADMGTGGREASTVGAYLFPSNQKPEIFTIAAGAAVTGIDFTLPPQSEYTVSGKVSGLTDGQIAAVAITLRDQPALAAALLQTDSSGEFRFERVAPGAYDLRAAAPTKGYGVFGAVLGENALFGRIQIEVAGQHVEEAQIPLEPSRPLKLMLDAAPGCPSGSVSVALDSLEHWPVMLNKPIDLLPNKEATVTGLPPGRFRVLPSQPAGICTLPESLIVESGTAEVVRIALEPPGAIEARLVTSDAVTLSYLGTSNIPVQSLPANPEGLYVFKALRPGRYRVQTGSTELEAEVRAAATTRVAMPAQENKQ